MKKKYFLQIILLGFIFSSCTKLEDVSDFPTEDPKLVVNSVFTPDSFWYFEVSKSLSVLDQANLNYIDDATIKLYENGILLETLSTPTTYNDGRIAFHSSTNKPIVGKNYSIKVSASGFEDVSSEGSLPNSIVALDVSKLSIISKTIEVYDSSTYDINAKMTITLMDPVNEDNYYELYLFSIDTFYWDWTDSSVYDLTTYMEYLYSEDPSVEGYNHYNLGSVLFTDHLFDGETHEMTFDIYTYTHTYSPSKKFYAMLRTHSRDSYLYEKSSSLYMSGSDNFFAEPVQVYNNIDNGYGIFGGYVTSKDSIVLQ